MIFHEQLWSHLQNNNEDGDIDTVSLDYTYAFLRILLDPRRMKIKDHYEFMNEFLADGGYNVLVNSKMVTGPEEKIIWSLKKIIAEYRKLNNHKISSVKTGVLKSDKIKEMQNKEEQV